MNIRTCTHYTNINTIYREWRLLKEITLFGSHREYIDYTLNIRAQVNTMKGSFVLLALAATLFASCQGYNGCPDLDHVNYTVHLPHPTNCSLFFRCDHGYPKLDRCPSILHFNPSLEVCDWPSQANCTAGLAPTTPPPARCSGLPVYEHGVWGPPSCNEGARASEVCKLTCTGDYQLSGGSDARCTADGWVGANGLNQIPECKEIADLGGAFIDIINKTLEGISANMIFLLDESYSLSATEFAMEVQFMKALVAAFPLSNYRAAGAITFESNSIVDISVRNNNTCTFMDQADRIRYGGGGTNILGALQLAISEVVTNGIHNFTLVFLITDGVSYTNPQAAADIIKSSGNALFTVGIGSFNPSQLRALASQDEDGVPIFFPIENFAVFQKVADYLEQAYNIGALNCTVPS